MMPSDDFWRRVPELDVLAEIADTEKFSFVLRGSAAQLLVDAYVSDEKDIGLFQSMPPLTDVDLLVDSKSQALALSIALGREIPISRFFRIDVRTKAELEHYQHAQVVVTGQPQIRFGGERQTAHEVLLELVQERLSVDVGSDVTLKPSVRRRDGIFEPVDSLINLLWLSRRCPGDDACADLSSEVTRFSPRRIGGHMRHSKLVTLLISLAKLLLSITTEKQQQAAWFETDFLGRVADEAEHPMLRRVVQLLRERPRAVKVVLVPRREGTRWKSQVETIEPLEQDWKVVDVENETAFRFHQRLPPARITTDDPERPGCCRYRDFSRGVAEIAWTAPEAPQSERLTVVTADREFFFAPSVTSTHRGQHAVKVDYGFLCQMSGTRRPIDIHYAGVEDVD
jgi:hypothetical protein